METISINIINPKAKKLLKDLADLQLISFNVKPNKVEKYLKKIRNEVKNPPSLEEITQMVEEVRTEMYKKTKKD